MVPEPLMRSWGGWCLPTQFGKGRTNLLELPCSQIFASGPLRGRESDAFFSASAGVVLNAAVWLAYLDSSTSWARWLVADI